MRFEKVVSNGISTNTTQFYSLHQFSRMRTIHQSSSYPSRLPHHKIEIISYMTDVKLWKHRRVDGETTAYRSIDSILFASQRDWLETDFFPLTPPCQRPRIDPNSFIPARLAEKEMMLGAQIGQKGVIIAQQHVEIILGQRLHVLVASFYRHHDKASILKKEPKSWTRLDMSFVTFPLF